MCSSAVAGFAAEALSADGNRLCANVRGTMLGERELSNQGTRSDKRTSCGAGPHLL